MIYNNIFYVTETAALSGTLVIKDAVGDSFSPFENYFNNNCYYTVGNFSNLGESTQATYDLYKAVWATQNKYISRCNDANSVNDDPLFADIGSYKLGSNSPCRNMGNVQTPQIDFNDDGIVDFIDFTIFAQNWLECIRPECD